jgi:hypothetical protein
VARASASRQWPSAVSASSGSPCAAISPRSRSGVGLVAPSAALPRPVPDPSAPRYRSGRAAGGVADAARGGTGCGGGDTEKVARTAYVRGRFRVAWLGGNKGQQAAQQDEAKELRQGRHPDLNRERARLRIHHPVQ